MHAYTRCRTSENYAQSRLQRTVATMATVGETDALVPEELLERLVEWQRFFDHHFVIDPHEVPNPRWDTEENKSEWAVRGGCLHRNLKPCLKARPLLM